MAVVVGNEKASEPEVGGPAGFKPYVPAHVTMPEFTFSAVLVGAVLGIIFGASSLYLVLRVGLTVSASIPVAVLAITLFRGFSKLTGFRQATILENNIVQTTGSAGESIAFGVGVTMPALMLLGFDMDLMRVMVVSLLGGLLGILMMIPLRRAFIVNMHGSAGQPGTLLYPEGTACAEVLISGEKGGTSGLIVFIGFGLAFGHKFVTVAMTVLRETMNLPLRFFNRTASIATDLAPELLGVGYVIGVRVAAIMMAGAVIGNLVIIPAIAIFGDGLTAALPPSRKPISEMSLGELQGSYLRFIGAGCVTAAGIMSMCRTLPLILRSFRSSLSSLRGVSGHGISRTERDMPIKAVLIGSLLLLGLLAAFLVRELTTAGTPGALYKAGLGALLVLLFGFLFVTVSSRLTGEIGSSSNPISGMTVATLTLTCGIFYYLGMISPAESVVALSIGGVVCIAASNGGTTSQDLKTGFLVGGTPIYQQYAILIGALTSALVIGGTLLVFNEAGTVYSKKNLPPITLLPDQYEALTERARYEGQEYRVWRPKRSEHPDVEEGKYYIGEDRRPALLEDPAVTGRLDKRDDGSDVKMKFPAPKTQVIGIIINGVLKQELNWGLILLGAMLAVGVELCGVSSLAFAVGVYIPMQYTTPIFCGGVIRYLVDTLTTRPPSADPADEAQAIAETETGPGVLMASGYIAGGTLAGVLIAFLDLPFFSELKKRVDFSQKPEGPDGPTGPLLAPDWIPWLIFATLMVLLYLVGRGLLSRPQPDRGPDVMA